MFDFLRSYHLLSISFGCLSAICWVISSLAYSRKYPEKEEDKSVSMLGHVKTGEIQNKWNAPAAFLAALAAFSQAFGI